MNKAHTASKAVGDVVYGLTTDDVSLMREFLFGKNNSNGWIPFAALPDGRVEVKYENGETDVGYANEFSWSNDNGDYNIVAYRILDE